MYFACAVGAPGRVLSVYLHTVFALTHARAMVYFDTPDVEVSGDVLCPPVFAVEELALQACWLCTLPPGKPSRLIPTANR